MRHEPSRQAFFWPLLSFLGSLVFLLAVVQPAFAQQRKERLPDRASKASANESKQALQRQTRRQTRGRSQTQSPPPRFSTLEQALNVEYPPSYNKGHNWVAHKAFEFLRHNASALMPEDLEELPVHYGLAFADNPWMGLPDSHRRWSAGVREDLWKKEIGREDNLVGNVKVEVGYPEMRTTQRPNLHLHVRWTFADPDLIPEATICYAADNISHYPHDSNLRVDGTGSSEGILVDGPVGQGNWRVKGDEYGAWLYQMARRFWPGNTPRPQLDELPWVPKVGRIRADVWVTQFPLPSDDPKVEVPGTYLGGNPFILTQQGGATWPIWVPDQYSPQKLSQQSPSQSKRAAAIYLGWSLHLLHDLSHPYHAMDRAGEKHAESEAEIDRWILDGKFDGLPLFDSLGIAGPAKKAKYTWSDRPVYRPQIWMDLLNRDFNDWSNRQVIHRYRECVNAAKSHYDDLQSSNEDRRLAACEHLLDMALKNTIMMIASVNHAGGSARPPEIEPTMTEVGPGIDRDGRPRQRR